MTEQTEITEQTEVHRFLFRFFRYFCLFRRLFKHFIIRPLDRLSSYKKKSITIRPAITYNLKPKE